MLRRLHHRSVIRVVLSAGVDLKVRLFYKRWHVAASSGLSEILLIFIRSTFPLKVEYSSLTHLFRNVVGPLICVEELAIVNPSLFLSTLEVIG